MAIPNAWRNSARPARFFIFDARAAIGFAIFMLHWSVLTFEIALAVFIVFGTLERWGFSANVAWRWLRSRIAGPVRSSHAWFHLPRDRGHS